VCLGIPGRIIGIEGGTARVEVAGAVKEASLALIEDVGVGDYVIIHAGFAIEKVDEAMAMETLRLIDEAAGLR
jgi:hydrogenase expression/formation protein HypC